jgi:hypothetical protein
MRKNSENRPKLVPLRRFVNNGPYSSAYLSLLVQRHKLKAEKIGRNYFTTEAWFKEYLEQHAQNGKWECYQEKNGHNNNIVQAVLTPGPCVPATEKPAKFKYQTAILTAAVFVLLVLAGMAFYFMNQEKGQVAGIEEKSTASSTIP